MKLHTTGLEACLLLVCTIILQVYTASLEGSTWPQPEAADSIKPLTVRPLGTSNVPQDQANKTYWETKYRRTTNERANESDSSQASSGKSKRSGDDDSSSGDRDTAEDTKPDTNQEQDDCSTEDSADDPSDTRRRRSPNDEERDKRRDDDDSKEDDEEEDGGLTREAAVVSPIRKRRRQITEDKDYTDEPSSESEGYDDTNPDTTEDTENAESSTETMNRREAETSTLGTLGGSPVIVVAPSGVPVKQIPQQLDHTLKKLEQRIDHFEEIATRDVSTVPTAGVLAGDSTKEDNGTIIHTISSAQYIVH